MLHRFTYQARKAVYVAQETAAGLGLTLVEPQHLLVGALHSAETTASQLLAKLGLDREAVSAAFSEESGSSPTSGWDMLLSDAAKQAVDRAYEAARGRNAEQFDTGYLLLGVLGDSTVCARLELAGVALTLPAARAAYERLEASPPETYWRKARLPEPASTTLPSAPSESTATPNFTVPLLFVGFMLLWLWRAAIEDVLVASGVLSAVDLLQRRGWVFVSGGRLAPVGYGPGLIAAMGWHQGIFASLWTVLVVPALCYGLAFRKPSRWAAIEAFLFTKGAFGLAQIALLSVAGTWSPLPGGVPPPRPGDHAPWVLLAAVAVFRDRSLFNVEPRDGWRILWRQGGWLLVITAVVEAIQLAAMIGLVR